MKAAMLHTSNDSTLAAFQACFRRQPQWVASAPGRVNLIGEFTDFNDGFVLPMAIEQRTTIAAAPNDSNLIAIWSEATGERVAFGLHDTPGRRPRGAWSNYVAGVLAGCMNAGVIPRGFDALIGSNVPIGAGLSSSAALEVAFATLLEVASDRRLDPVFKALLCQAAEHDYAGVPCGIMDQFIATLGREDHALLLDCRSHQVTWLPFIDSAVSVLVIDSHVKHEHANGAYAQRRQECEAAAHSLGVAALRDASLDMLDARASGMDAAVARRARHVITETERTLAAAQSIQRGDWRRLGELLDAGHKSLKYDYEVTCNELDILVDLARNIGPRAGVLGCRMTGGGFGGCAVALIETSARESIVEEIGRGYRARTGITASFFTSRPAVGAQFLTL